MTGDITREKLFRQIAQLQTQMDDLEAKMIDADEKKHFKLSLIYSSLGKQITNLYTALTRIRVAELEVEKANAKNGKSTNDKVVFKGTREEALAALKQKKLDDENKEMRDQYAIL